MTVRELIEQLQKLPNQEAGIAIKTVDQHAALPLKDGTVIEPMFYDNNGDDSDYLIVTQ